jgi:hypothetical protein
LKRTVVNWLGEIEVHQYPDIFLDIELSVDGAKVLSGKRIEKVLFAEHITYHKLSGLTLSYAGISDLLKEKIILNFSLCVPDTDDCYIFHLNIFINGEITIIEREINWDFY